jgi:cell wall assembly regulator SMI1
MNSIKYTCPCCGYKTFDREDHLWEICEVCFWESCPIQDVEPLYLGGPNHTSLAEAQQNFIAFGACEESSLPSVRKQRKDEPKDENWNVFQPKDNQMILDKLFDEAQKVMPNLFEKLGVPATTEQIDLIKNSVDFEIDPLLIEFWKRCNGDENLSALGLGVFFTSIEKSILFLQTEWYDWHSLADNHELCKNRYFSKKRIPFMEDGGGSTWFLDYDPAAQGTAGQVICIFRDFAETIYNVAPSFKAFLQLILTEFEQNRVKIHSDYDSFDFECLQGNLPIFWAAQSILQAPHLPKIPDDFFVNMSEDWKYACSNGGKNFVKNRDGVFLGDKNDAYMVREIWIGSDDMMADFDNLKHLPKVQFLTMRGVTVSLEDKHIDIIKMLRLTSLDISNPVKNIGRLAQIEVLQILRLENVTDSDIGELAELKNIRNLDITLSEPYPSFEFVSKMDNLETLRLTFKSKYKLPKTDVEAISKVPKLNSLSFINAAFSNWEVLENCKTLVALSNYIQ